MIVRGLTVNLHSGQARTESDPMLDALVLLGRRGLGLNPTRPGSPPATRRCHSHCESLACPPAAAALRRTVTDSTEATVTTGGHWPMMIIESDCGPARQGRGHGPSRLTKTMLIIRVIVSDESD